MPFTITQVRNGVPHGQTYVSTPSAVDSGNSKIYASSLFVHVNENGQDVAKSKDTDDKIVLGYTSEGMAFQIVVDGFYGCDRSAVFKFIDDYVVPLLEKYSQNLSLQNDATLITTTLIKNIYLLRKQFAPSAEFTMSLGACYEKNDELYFAGFGIGDTGLVIKRKNGDIEQLVAHTEVNGFKDAFDDFSTSSIDSVIARNSMFNTKVAPGDEIMGYTYILPQLEELEREFEAETVSAKGKVQRNQVRVLNLNPGNFAKDGALFDQFLQLTKEIQISLIKKAVDSGEPQRFGDDFAVANIVIPSADLRHQIKMQSAIHVAKSGLQEFITQENRNRGFMGIYGLFSGATKNVEQATLYQEMLTAYRNEPFIAMMFILAITGLDNPASQHLVRCLGFQSKPALRNQLKALLAVELTKPDFVELIDSQPVATVIAGLESNITQYFARPTEVPIDEVLKPYHRIAVVEAVVG